MLVNQISVFIENKPGRLNRLSEVLAKNSIDLLTLSIADTKDYGILRAVTNDNLKAVKILKEEGFTVSSTDLIGVEVEDKPGGLASILRILDESKISIDYLYSYARTPGNTAIILLRVENTDEALKTLKLKGVKLISKII